MKYGILSIAENGQSKFPCFLLFLISQPLVFYICDVVRSMNKDEDVIYMDTVHKKLQEKNINCWVTIAGKENKLLGNNALKQL